MAIPDYQSLMLPLLDAVADGGEYKMREIISGLANQFQLTEAERSALLPSGGDVFSNRAHWARSYLKKSRAAPKSALGIYSNY